MTTPVDLTNLREMTDGDKELEKQLFSEYFSSSEECINTLQNNCTDGENESWRTAAHAFKGTSYNLGAQNLGDLCKKAQESNAAPATKKQEMLQAIQSEYQNVKTFLQKAE